MTSAVVQLAIGMVLVFFLVGSACSFLNELAAAILNRRAIHLQRWLVKLLGPDKDSFLDHPLIRELRGARLDLRRDKRDASQGASPSDDAPTGLRRLRYSKVPSYVSAATFATTLLSLLGRTDKVGATPATAKDLNTAISKELKDPSLQAVLRTLLHDAGGDVVQFKRRLEQWFDEEMDRLSGWYKRRTKWFLLLWGLGLAIVLNVDAALLVRTLWTDSTLRGAVVAEAQRVATPPTTAAGASSSPTTTVPCPIPVSGTPAGSAASTTAPDPLDCLTARIESLQALQLPIGWPGWPFQSVVYQGIDKRAPHHPADWGLKTFGLIITALAAMQGGPFWFDLLGKLINLRLTGPPPAKPAQGDQAQPQPAGALASRRNQPPA
ncbi:MAG TPA: hypothetical protein VG276_08990 [Actinomycetes bacterium]|jgi:hypothetical protein|nr:hypothetical protein [Actinomycetes bacterium]